MPVKSKRPQREAMPDRFRRPRTLTAGGQTIGEAEQALHIAQRQARRHQTTNARR
jgi:hypothetical protein